MEIKEISPKSPSEKSFANEIHSFLKRADARESAVITYLICDAHVNAILIRYFDNYVVAHFLGHPVVDKKTFAHTGRKDCAIEVHFK